MELTLFALFGSIFWGIASIIAFIIICFMADLSENGYLATFFLIILGILFYFFGKELWDKFISLLTFTNIAIYLGLGLVHAFIRTFFHGRNEMKRVNEDRLNGRSYEHSIDREIKGNVFRWWFLWPISLIDWFIKDMIKEIWDWAYSKFSDLFDFFLNMGIKSVKEFPKTPSKR